MNMGYWLQKLSIARGNYTAATLRDRVSFFGGSLVLSNRERFKSCSSRPRTDADLPSRTKAELNPKGALSLTHSLINHPLPIIYI